MPNRVVRESILDSERVNQLGWSAEVFYRRLMSVVDDYGRFDARLPILRSRLFPIRIDRVSEPDIAKWISECETAGLVRKYQVDNRDYIEILNFGQTLRQKKATYPNPPWSNIGKDDPSGYVYVVGTDWGGPVKIGFSLNPWARVKEVSIGSPFDLSLLFTVKGTKSNEAEIHKVLSNFKVKNEWFQLSEKVANVFRSNYETTTELLRYLRPPTMPESETKRNESETKPDAHTREKVPRGVSGDDFYDSGQQMFDHIKSDDQFVERLLRVVQASGFISCKEIQVLKAARFFITREAAKPDFQHRPRSEHKNYLVNWITKQASTLNQYDK